jgi:hypothetical protein
VEKLIPDKPIEEKIIIEPRYLDEDVVDVPAMALEQVRFEIGHMGGIINGMFSTLRKGIREDDRQVRDLIGIVIICRTKGGRITEFSSESAFQGIPCKVDINSKTHSRFAIMLVPRESLQNNSFYQNNSQLS